MATRKQMSYIQLLQERASTCGVSYVRFSNAELRKLDTNEINKIIKVLKNKIYSHNNETTHDDNHEDENNVPKATNKQINYIRRLQMQLPKDVFEKERLTIRELGQLNRRQASQIIKDFRKKAGYSQYATPRQADYIHLLQERLNISKNSDEWLSDKAIQKLTQKQVTELIEDFKQQVSYNETENY